MVAIGSDIGPGSRPLIQLVEAETGTVVAETLAFEEAFRGGTRLAMANVDGRPGNEIVIGSGPGRVAEICVFTIDGVEENTRLRELPEFRLRPFGNSYFGGIAVAAGEVNGDGHADIAAAKSRGSEVSVFLSPAFGGSISQTPYQTFVPFGGGALGGAALAFADVGTFVKGSLVDGTKADGLAELAVVSGTGMKPVAKIYDLSGATARTVDRFTPFTPALVGGMSVAAIYDGTVSAAANARLASFAAFAGSATPKAAAFTAPVDRNGDGRIDGFGEVQGLSGGGGAAGLAFLGQSGTRTNLFANVKGPQQAASARTSYNDFQTTLSGIKYRVIKPGTGATPKVGDKVTTHYTGWLVDGTKFDSSRDKKTPFSFTLGQGQVIKGWDEIVAKMNVGERVTAIIPASLAYGSTARPGIPANSTLVFDMRLLSVG